MKFLKSLFRLVAACLLLGALFGGVDAYVRSKMSPRPASSADMTLEQTPLPSAPPAPPAPDVSARAVVLMDARSGKTLYASNPNEELPPASTTKLMTMLLILKDVHAGRVSWNDVVPITPDALKIAANPGYSNAHLRPTDRFTLRQMMSFIAVLSANDATVAVADHLAGSQSAFVGEMNAEARKLGLHNTHFANPDGLPAANHHMSAADLASLSRYLIQTYPDILTFTSLRQVSIHNTRLPSTDELLGKYPGLDGLKTGYTNSAGYCFVGTATRSQQRLIVVVMGATASNPQLRFQDAGALLDYGFRRMGL